MSEPTQYLTHDGIQYLPWWEDYFPYHVFVRNSDDRFLMKNGFDAVVWLRETYPDTNGDDNIHRYTETDLPWYEYDWGLSRETDRYLLYFKDAKIAAHFKLVWS